MFSTVEHRSSLVKPVTTPWLITHALSIELLWILGLSPLILLPGVFVSTEWQPFLIASLFFFWPLRWLMGRKATSHPFYKHWTLYLLLLWIPVTLASSSSLSSAWAVGGYLLLGVAIYTAIQSNDWLCLQPIRLAQSLLLLSLLVLVAAPPLVKWKSEFRLFYTPLYDWFQAIQFSGGETIHANVLAGALILLLPIALSLLVSNQAVVNKVQMSQADGQAKTIISQQKKHWQAKLWQIGYLLLTLSMLTLLLLTQSRGGYLSTIVSLLVIGLLRWPRLLYMLPLLAAGLFFFIDQSDFQQIFDLLGADNTFGGAEWRGPVLSASWQAFQDFTWTGIGIGNFQQVMPLLYPNPAINSPSATHAHNLLLQIGLDLGLPGLAAYLTFYITMIGMAIAVLRRTRSPQGTAAALGATWDGKAIIAPPDVGVTLSTKRFMRQLVHLERTRQQHWALAAGCLAALVGMQVHGLLDAVTWGNKLAFIPWLIFAQITLLYRYQTHDHL